MKIEVFPYRFRGKASGAALHRRERGALDVSTAKELFDLYNAGVSFRPMPDTDFSAVVFDLDDVLPDYAPRIDSLNLPGVFVAKSPSAILGIPGKVFRRKVFFQLSAPCKFADYEGTYAAAFAKFILDASLPLLGCDKCMQSPRQMTFGRPFPGMTKAIERIEIPGMDKCRPPLPLSRYAAKEIFRIDDAVLLPPLEFKRKGRVAAGERHGYVWRSIIPAAFSWLRFFETTAETRWGLNSVGYTFKDCENAIRSAMIGIGVGQEEAEAVIRGRLYAAYSTFSPPEPTRYVPRSQETDPAGKGSRWSRKTKEQKRAIYDRQKARRRLNAFLTGRRAAGRPCKVNIGSLEDLEAAYASGEISKSYYFRLRKILGAPPRKRGRPHKG